MKIELSADLAKEISELLHDYQKSVMYDMSFASYCGEVAKKFDDAVEQAKKDVSVAKLNLAIKRKGKKNGNIN